MMSPIATERVVSVARRQWGAFDKQENRLSKLRHVLTALLRKPDVTPKQGATDRIAHDLDSQVPQ